MQHGHDAPIQAPAPWLRPIAFTTEDLPPRQRLDAWNARFRSLNTVTVPDPRGTPISTSNENWLLGPMLFSASRASSSRFERSRLQVRGDGLDHWVIRVLRRGSNRLDTAGQRHAIADATPLLFSIDQPWVSEWEDAAWVSLCLPRDASPRLSAGLAALGPGPMRIPAASFLSDYLLMLERQIRVTTADSLPALSEATRAVLSASLQGSGGGIAPEHVAAAQFERVRAIIRRHIGSPLLDAQRLARMAGMSRSALYRLFEPHGGVARHIQAMRLRLVHASLADPSLAAVPIAALAERAGFFDPSTFSRAFRAQFGYPPRQARLAALAGRGMAPVRLRADEAEPPVEFGALLRRIGAEARQLVSAAAEPVRTA